MIVLEAVLDSIYDDMVFRQPTGTVEKIVPQRWNNDHKQHTMMKVLNAYLNQGGEREEFEDWCRSEQGQAYIKKSVHHAFIDLFRTYVFRKQPKADEKYHHPTAEDVLWPTATAFADSDGDFESSTVLDFMADGRATDDFETVERISDAKRELDAVYADATDDQREAIEILYEWMRLKQQGESTNHLRKRLHKLKKRINASLPEDQQWGLNPRML